jgi:hypothetical protein
MIFPGINLKFMDDVQNVPIKKSVSTLVARALKLDSSQSFSI